MFRCVILRLKYPGAFMFYQGTTGKLRLHATKKVFNTGKASRDRQSLLCNKISKLWTQNTRLQSMRCDAYVKSKHCLSLQQRKFLKPTKQRNSAYEKIMKVHLKACCSSALSSCCIASGRILSNTGEGAAIVGKMCLPCCEEC